MGRPTQSSPSICSCSSGCTVPSGNAFIRSSNNETRRKPRQGNLGKKMHVSTHSWAAFGACIFRKTKRLSATDISALASMKNVAKCDTWCELQNPVNHRVFERKLRLKPLGRRHVCLGVTRPVTHRPRPSRGRLRRGGILASRARSCLAGLKTESPTTDVTTSGGCLTVA